MKTIAKMHLLVDEVGSKRLLDTMEVFNNACNEIAETCFNEQTASKYTIQQLVYHNIRDKYGLSAQLTIRAIAKTCEAYKVNKAVKPGLVDILTMPISTVQRTSGLKGSRQPAYWRPLTLYSRVLRVGMPSPDPLGAG